MSGWHLGPLAGFDLETTGADPEDARIVTAAVLQRGPEDRDLSWLVNPGVEIPEAATAVHGITTEKARDLGLDPAAAITEICDELWRAFAARIPVVIYNAPYDLTVLDRETRRHGLEPFGDILRNENGLIVDPFVLDKHADPYRKGKRQLTVTCAYYGVTLDGAHDAGADALAAMRLAWKIASKYFRIGARSLEDLQALQVGAKAEQSASLADYFRRRGEPADVDGSWPIRAFAAVPA